MKAYAISPFRTRAYAFGCALFLAITVSGHATAETTLARVGDPIGTASQSAGADEQAQVFEHITTPPERGIDCTFFRSQAFNQADDHFTTLMARMCAMLSRYKTTVIDANSSRFRAALAADQGSNATRRIAPIDSAPEASKYLIAREIGLIDALTAMPAADGAAKAAAE
ncbi:MAG: hypothetical protein AAF160_08570 [Pseudomonadota bacterium]